MNINLAVIFISIIAILWCFTIVLNKKFDDDHISDNLRSITAVLLTILVLFFWYWW